MRPAECLFDIIRLRGSSRPLSAAVLAARLEVSVRAIYRDVASLLGSGVRIEGASGFGYVLGSGYDLHPLMFTAAEFQTIAVALDLPPRTDDRGLQEAAAWGRAKVAAVRLPTAGPWRKRPTTCGRGAPLSHPPFARVRCGR